jgi:hypothetical protein
MKERTPLNMTGGQLESFYFGYAPKANFHSMIKALKKLLIRFAIQISKLLS